MKANFCEDFAIFLAHSVALEQESAARLYELADAMTVHNNEELITLLSWLAELSEAHVREVEAIASDHQLPVLAPWDFEWEAAEAPETAHYDRFHYLMTVPQVLAEVYAIERSAELFYLRVAEHSKDLKISQCALSFAQEEKQHADAVKKLMSQQAPGTAIDQPVDWDPPMMPE